jgi:putative hydrolase of the HAD superfamily
MGKVLFDFDFKAFGERMRELTGLEYERLRAAFTGEQLGVRYESGLLSDMEFYTEVCRRAGCRVSWENFVAAWNSIFYQDPILPERLVRTLASKADLWVVSNTNKLHFDHLTRRHPFLDCFKGFVLSHEVGVLKPDARIFRAALTRAGFEAERALFVDDQAANVAAARDLGIDSFQFLSPDQFVDEVRRRNLL